MTIKSIEQLRNQLRINMNKSVEERTATALEVIAEVMIDIRASQMNRK